MTESSLATAKKLLAACEHEQCFWTIKDYWLQNPEDKQAPVLMSELMRTVGKTELAESLSNLTDSTGTKDNLARHLFDAGFRFIDERQPELAALLLANCIKLAPDEPTANYELGFALLSLKRYADAIPHLELALRDTDDFDSRLNLAVAYSCLRKTEPMEKMLAGMVKMASNDEERQEVSNQQAVLARLKALSNKKSLTARDWLYIHYGSVLINQNKDSKAGTYGQISETYSTIARTLIILRGLLDSLGCEYDVVEYYSSLSRPLAASLAELMDLPCDIYRGANRQERALLVMAWASDMVGPHEVLAPHTPLRSIFTYCLTSCAPLPFAPELVGCLAEACALPWSERFQVTRFEDGRSPLVEPIESVDAAEWEGHKRAIHTACANLESDPHVLESVQSLSTYLHPLSTKLLLDNSKSFPRRPEYTNELPP